MSCERHYDYWEKYGTPHDDNLNLFMNTEDLTLTGKFLFLDKKMKLTGKVKLNAEAGNPLSSAPEYSLKHTVNPWTEYSVSQKSANKYTFDGNFELWRNPRHYFSLLSVMSLEQDDKRRAMPSKLHLRYHHRGNGLISIGLEDYDPFQRRCPDVFSMIAIAGSELGHGYKGYGGCYSGFRFSERALTFHNYLLALKHKTVAAFMSCGFRKTQKREIEQESGEEKVSHVWEKEISLKVDGKPCSRFSTGGDVSYNFESKNVDTRFYGIFEVDPDTTLKARWQPLEHTLTMSLNRTLRGLINFGVAGRVNKNIK